MAINTQFSIAVHIMAGLATECGKHITSSQLAESVNTSPSFVRRILAKLSKAGLIETSTGKAGACRINRDSKGISLLDIYKAVDAPKAFAIHKYAEQKPCIVSCYIKCALEQVLEQTQQSLEASLSKVTLAELVKSIKNH